MEEYHNLSLNIWSKICADWFAKCFDGCIVFIWYKFIHFSLHLNPPMNRMDSLPNILRPRCKKADESHPHFMFHCKLSKTTLDFISGLINLNYTFNMPFKVSPKAKSKAIINGTFISHFMMRYIQRFSIQKKHSQAFFKDAYDKK